MKSPQNAAGITQQWIAFMLTEYESKSNGKVKIQVKTFSVESATKPGESFNAELVKLKIDATLEWLDREPSAKQYNLIAKFLSQDPFNREMVKKAEYHLRELKMYAEVSDKLNSFQQNKLGENKYPICLPNFIYGKCTKRDYVLVMEDEKAAGFQTVPKDTGLDLAHMKLALSQAAHLHAVSYAYNKENPNFLVEYPCFKFNDVISSLFKPVVYSSLDNVIRFLRTKEEEYKTIMTKLESARQKLPSKFNALWDDQSRHRFLTLTHGDFWISNLLFCYKNSHMENLKVIDWQLSIWNNPFMDVHYLLNTSTTRSLRKSHLKDLLQHYLLSFNDAMEALSSEQPLSGEEFKMEFERLSIVGFLMGVCLTQGTLSKAGELINVQTEQSNSGFASRLKNSLKSVAAKIVIPVAFAPTSQWMVRSAIKKKLDPIGKELISGENNLMNSRLLDLILEAEESGLLDVMNV